MRTPNPLRRSVSAGFTLIELLAVILILGILMTFLIPQVMSAVDTARVTACRKNMSEIFSGLVQYQMKNKTKDCIPTQSGVKFFASLIADGVWENTEPNSKKLSCPGVSVSQLSLNDIDKAEDWYTHLDSVDGGYSAYAGRDQNAPTGKAAKGKGDTCGRIGQVPGSGKQILVA